MSSTLILAIWGSVLSTILAFLKILEYRKDKADVKVTVKGNYKIFPQKTVYGDKKLVLITAANRGRRPITLRGAALLLPRGKPEKTGYLLCADPMTAMRDVELSEGKSHQYLMEENGLIDKYKLPPEKYVACVWDATGRYYWSHNIIQRFLKLHKVK